MTASPTLLVVVDTEEEFDWFAPFDRASTSVGHMRDIGAFQSICDAHKIRPVYAVTYPIATQAESIAPLREIHASGRCEIGAHLHPWVTPPREEEVNSRNSYPGNLPRDLEKRKIEALLLAIENKLGVRPRSYKSGRYGFGPNTAATLAELGFEVDLSPLPAFDLSSDGGPDWSRASPAPRWLGPGLLTLPATSAFVGFARSAGPKLHRLASSPPLSWLRAPSLLSKTGALERLMLSPEDFLPDHHVRLTRALLDQGVRVFSFTLHSPSIRPGCTPYVRTERDREKFLDACRRYFDFFQGELGGVSMTPLELKRHLESSPPRPRPCVQHPRPRVKILGISPLDKDATASLVEDGRVLFAAGEERFSRVKQHAGFPHKAIEAALSATGTNPDEIDSVAYAFLPWDKETALIEDAIAAERAFQRGFVEPDLQKALARAEERVPDRSNVVHGLRIANEKMEKGFVKDLFYLLAGGNSSISRRFAHAQSRDWAKRASADHKRFQEELEDGLRQLGLLEKLRRGEHHLSHAANAYLASGFERALIVTIDGYGTGLAGSISLGEGGKIKRLKGLAFPHSLGSFYEMVTSSLGFHPDRHAGKIVGLAAWGDPAVLSEVLLGRIEQSGGDFRILDNLNVYFSRHLASRFPKVDLAAAWQHVLEVVAVNLVRYWVDETKCDSIVLSGGVTANVKMNQRLHEIEDVERTFVYPNMGDGGCGTGLATLWSWPGGARTIHDVYYGPSYTPAEIRAELEKAGLAFAEPASLVREVAQRIHAGEVIGRFGGRMEYGPRALGNRSILYHAKEPDVNQWLNKRLGRTEFMPFAPVTLWEAREKCYVNVQGAEHAAEFMTMTFDCTEWMRKTCPAAVHIDGTARPQLVRREVNAEYYDILKEYEKLSGIPCLINTSFNMHEEPIVCSPADAVRAFLQGNLDGLAIGPYFVPHPSRKEPEAGSLARTREPQRAAR